MGIDAVKHIVCARCGVRVNAKLSRYLFVLLAERGASKFGNRGNTVFGRAREESEICFCGPCSDELRQLVHEFRLGAGLNSFARSFMTSDENPAPDDRRGAGLEELDKFIRGM